MTPKQEAERLINEYRMLLMNEDTECGNEILCTSIAVKCALKAIDFNIKYNTLDLEFLQKVKKEIENHELS